jgi:A/G-specific adenine glycosylase
LRRFAALALIVERRHSLADRRFAARQKGGRIGLWEICCELMPKRHTPPLHFAPEAFQRALLAWYDGARRDLPWRAKPGAKPDPYKVWLSEIMLQQTTVKAVIPYFENFMARWPAAADLAAASRDEVLAAWAGLGYYSRARNLYACAQAVARSGFPGEEAALRALPGIGAYTAAAIAAIAFDEPAAVVDGNVERVIARLFTLETPLPKAKPAIREFAVLLTPAKRPGDYAQAMMDLGATICTPRSPSCLLCPATDFCRAPARGDAERFPLKQAKAAKPTRRGDAFVIVRQDGGGPQILLRRRKDAGLLGGMMEVPCSEWSVARETGAADPAVALNTKGKSRNPSPQPSPSELALASSPLKVNASASGCGWRGDAPSTAAAGLPLPWGEGGGEGLRPGQPGWTEGQTVKHTFTHFHLLLRVFARTSRNSSEANAHEGEWAGLANLKAFALPAVMKKAVASGLEALGIEAPDVQPPAGASRRTSSVATVERSARPSTRAGRK